MSEFVEETKFQYYAMNKDNLIVYGFDDVNEAKTYCSKNTFKLKSRLSLKRLKIDFNDINNWSDNYPEY